MLRRVIVAGVSACVLGLTFGFSQTAKAQTTSYYCWVDALSGHVVDAEHLVPNGGELNPTDPNHVSFGGRTFFRGVDGSWTDTANGHVVDSDHLVPNGGLINPTDPRHVAFGGRTFVRVPCPPTATQTAQQAGAIPAWTGWVGVNGGFATGTGNFRETSGTGNFSTSGGTFGGTLGVGARIGPYKVGLESDINWANFNGSSNTNCAVGCGVATHWFATVRPLVGVQIADTGVIPYITGGLAIGNVSANVTGFPGVSQTNVGWTAGGGVAFPLGMWSGHRLVGKVEYLHIDFGSVQCMPATCGGTADVKSTQEVFRGGINVAF